MATFYNPPQFGREYKLFVSLISQADTKLMQANPTLAAGDVQVDKDGANNFTNLNTIPAVVGTTVSVEVTLSAAEMTANNVTVVFKDATGDEWADLTINIQPSMAGAGIVRATIDDTAFAPTTTQFECDDITVAAAGHFNGRTIVFIPSVNGTDDLDRQFTSITNYELSGGRGKFTVTALTTPPANDDEFIIY